LKINIFRLKQEEIFNVILKSVQIKYFDFDEEIHTFQKRLYANYFKKPLDTIEDDWEAFYNGIRKYFFNCRWYKVYDFLEFIINNYPNKYKNDTCVSICNYILKKELSAYCFVGGQFTQITSQEEISVSGDGSFPIFLDN